jgi:hypothetical protein
MSKEDADTEAPELGARNSRRGRKPGSHPNTVKLGRQVRGALEQGLPLGVLVANLQSQGVISDQKTLRRQLKAANRADGLPEAERRSSSPAVTRALRAFKAHSAEHYQRYQHLEGPGGGPKGLEYWESAAIWRSLIIDLEKAMATASGRDRTAVIAAREAQRAFYEANVARLRP